jgi:hypothetical protein
MEPSIVRILPIKVRNLTLLATLDAADYEREKQYKWRVLFDRTGRKAYVIRHEKRDGKWRIVYLHRSLLGITDRHIEVDHIDHNGLNCTRANLRACTRRQNMQHRRKRTDGTSSKYKGVHPYRRSPGKWQATVKVDGKYQHIGIFDDEVAAARAYDQSASFHFGKWACVNFPTEGQSPAL